MPSVTAENRVSAIVDIYAHASTFPCRVVTEAGETWVMKLRGSGPGPIALLTELLALRAARSMGVPVPEARPLYLPPDFPWTIGTDEFDGIVQRSFGWNLGVAYIDRAITARAEQIFADAGFVDALAAIDSALCNMDRTDRNPNVLMSPHGPIAIDFDACLFARRAAKGVVPAAFPLPPGHLLSGRIGPAAHRCLDPAVVLGALDDAPTDWLDALGLDAEGLGRDLSNYIEAWNAT